MNKKELVEQLLTSNRGARVLIWGPSGTGKTYFGLTFPGVKIYDFDGGLLTGVSKDLPEFVDASSYESFRGAGAFEQFLRDWKADIKNPKIQTLFIDSLTSLSDHMMRTVLKLDGKDVDSNPKIQHWGSLINQLRTLFYSAVAESGTKNLVVSAHSQILADDEEGKVKYVPLIAGKKLPDRIGLWFDEVYHAEVAGMQSARKFRLATIGCQQYDAKSRIKSFAPLETFEPNDWRIIWAKASKALGELRESLKTTST